ncbi:MAG: glycosyltransferase family 4 protein [Candidatus Omnitrophica bacterium]|nr:glycosyltransferase family 4 protein [Candidatus Omnitrophota bacterium]
MVILSVSLTDLWSWGKSKGIPSLYASQKSFVQRGHSVYFLCPLRTKDSRQKEDYEGIRIVRFCLPFNISSLSVINLSSDKLALRLRSSFIFNLEWLLFQIFGLIHGIRLSLSIKPHIIYVHGLTPALPGFIISRLFNAKLIIRVYGTRELYWQWDNLWLRIKEFRDYLSFKIPADYFIITNDGNYGDSLARRLGVPAERIRNWRNGVDFDMYEPDKGHKEKVLKELGLPLSTKVIISTARLIPIYGVDRLIFALSELFKKNQDCICIILGDGPQRQMLREYVNKVGIQNRIFFLGIVDRERVKQFLNAADIFVLLSKYHNCTNTMWEAMVCGKCIVTIENEAIREVLTHQVNAILIRPDEIPHFSQILSELLNDEILIEQLGKRAHLRAREILEPWEVRMEREVRLLEELCKVKI